MCYTKQIALLSYANAGVVKLADTPDLGSGAVRCAGSSPVIRTLQMNQT